MDKMKIVGISGYDFKNADGERVQGTSYFYLMDDERVTGQRAGKFSLSPQKRARMDYVPNVGDDVWVIYDRYGKPLRFEKVGT